MAVEREPNPLPVVEQFGRLRPRCERRTVVEFDLVPHVVAVVLDRCDPTAGLPVVDGAVDHDLFRADQDVDRNVDVDVCGCPHPFGVGDRDETDAVAA